MSVARAKLRSFARGRSSAERTSVPAANEPRLFPANLPAANWQMFRTMGYSSPVTGIIYRNAPSFIGLEDRPRPVSGVPLGGIDTGGLYLEGYGTFGYSSIFNNYVPPGGP